MNKVLKYELIRSILYTRYMEDKISFIQWQSIMSRLSREHQKETSNSLAIVKTQL